MKHIISLFIVLVAAIQLSAQQKPVDSIQWAKQILIQNQPVFSDPGGVPEAGGTNLRRHGNYGSQYPRLLKLNDGSWLACYTISRNSGYKNDPKGGLELEFSTSRDDCRTWKPLSIISDPGRDMDNAQMIELPDGSILLACRSVRWQESYVLPVYKSTDMGKTWERLSVIDETHGKPGELGKPDKGMYEPHFYFLDDGRLSVMYANETHVVGKSIVQPNHLRKNFTRSGENLGQRDMGCLYPWRERIKTGNAYMDENEKRKIHRSF